MWSSYLNAYSASLRFVYLFGVASKLCEIRPEVANRTKICGNAGLRSPDDSFQRCPRINDREIGKYHIGGVIAEPPEMVC